MAVNFFKAEAATDLQIVVDPEELIQLRFDALKFDLRTV
jgi:hypothetical protein